jgi:thioredoxin 1
MSKLSFNELISGSTPVLVDFYADWCGPCQTMSPIIEEVARGMSDKIKVIKINTDKNPNVSSQYGIRGIPTFILFQNGRVLWRASGAMPRREIEQQLKPFVG